MDAPATLDACNQKSGSDAESTEHALLMPMQLLVTGAAHEGQAGADGHLSSGFGRENERMCCQVADCPIDLRSTKPYCMKKRLCPEHLTAHAVRRRGGVKGFWRFCQQCGKLEPLESFDGTKRSCRARLQKRRAHNTQRAADPWRSGKHKGQGYKAKQLQRQKQESASLAVDDEDGMDDTDGDDDELQSDGMQDRGQTGAAAAAVDGGHGLPEHLDSTAAAAGYASLGAPSVNYQQQQQAYHSALYNAAMAAAAADGGQAHYTGASATGRSAALRAALPAPQSGLHSLQEAITASRSDPAGMDGAGQHKAWHAAMYQDRAWASNSALDAPHSQQQQQEQEAPSPESIAATLAAMAAAAKRSDQQHFQQAVKQEPPLQQSPLHQQQQHWQRRKSPAGAAAMSSDAQQCSAAHSPSSCEDPSINLSNQQQQQQAQQFVYGDAAYDSPEIAQRDLNGYSSYQYSGDQQQQRNCDAADRMEVDAAAAAAAAVPAAPQAAAVTRARMLAAAAAAAAAAVAVDADHGPSSPGRRHQKLHSLLGRLIGDMVPQADAAATLAAMRSQPPSTATVDVAGPGHVERLGLDHHHQQQQQHSAAVNPAGGGDVAAVIPAHITTPTGRGIFPAPSGLPAHSDQAPAAAAFMEHQQQPRQQQQEEVFAQGLVGQAPVADASSNPPAASSHLVQGRPAALERPVQARGTAAPTHPLAAAAASGCEQLPQVLAAAGSKEAGGAGGGLGAVDGLGMLLSAGLNSMLSQQGQNGPAGGVQLLASLLAQAPTAAATLLLAQQQQLQQLQAQQQRLAEQLAQQQQQQEERYNVLLAAATSNSSSRVPSHVTTDVVELVRDQLQAVSEQVAESLAPLQGQVDSLRAELGRVKSVVQATGLQTELDRIKDAVSNLLQH